MTTGPAGVTVVGGASYPIGDTVFVAKVTASGAPASGFGVDGRIEFRGINRLDSVQINDLQVLPDGRVAVLYEEEPTHEFGLSSVVLLDASGEPDPSFGDDGTVQVGLIASDVPARTMTVSGAGGGLGLFVAGIPQGSSSDLFVQRLSLSGVIDQGYGAADGSDDGWVGVDFPKRGLVTDRRLLAGAADGSIIWGASAVTPGPGDGLALGKILSDGTPDASFGSTRAYALSPGSPGPLRQEASITRCTSTAAPTAAPTSWRGGRTPSTTSWPSGSQVTELSTPATQAMVWPPSQRRHLRIRSSVRRCRATGPCSCKTG